MLVLVVANTLCCCCCGINWTSGSTHRTTRHWSEIKSLKYKLVFQGISASFIWFTVSLFYWDSVQVHQILQWWKPDVALHPIIIIHMFPPGVPKWPNMLDNAEKQSCQETTKGKQSETQHPLKWRREQPSMSSVENPYKVWQVNHSDVY